MILFQPLKILKEKPWKTCKTTIHKNPYSCFFLHLILEFEDVKYSDRMHLMDVLHSTWLAFYLLMTQIMPIFVDTGKSELKFAPFIHAFLLNIKVPVYYLCVPILVTFSVHILIYILLSIRIFERNIFQRYLTCNTFF